ncbi:Transposon Tf2-9 polyprotein [Exaiptasia diaphana]|nr:Transposon Tf2-9 polyprotein [Exaiptasia diaphana]
MECVLAKMATAPENFQRRMSEILSGLPGTLCLIDDTLIYVRTQQEHDERLNTALERIRAAGLTLNKEKCKFSQSQITFLGQVIDANGVRPDPSKVKAIIVDMAEPTDRSELRRFLGMTNQLGKFTSKSAEITKPLRELLSLKNDWHWGPSQQQAFQKLKKELSDPNKILAHYDPTADTVVSSDASSYGLGAVVTQLQENGEWQPYHTTQDPCLKQRSGILRSIKSVSQSPGLAKDSVIF